MQTSILKIKIGEKFKRNGVTYTMKKIDDKGYHAVSLMGFRECFKSNTVVRKL